MELADDENFLSRIDIWNDDEDTQPKKHKTRAVHDKLSKLLYSLESFVSSRGKDGIQLGRNHPQSTPEIYVRLRPLRSSSSLNAAATASEELEQHGIRLRSQVGNERRPRLDLALTPDEFILRELADIRRLLLQRFLNQGGNFYYLEPNDEILDILGVLSTGDETDLGEPPPHYPVGVWDWAECQVCFESRWLYRRVCCNFPACGDCLRRYFASKVVDGMVKIECCNPMCHSFVHRDEVSARLEPAAKEKFHQFLASANQDPLCKTCPRCNHLLKISKLNTMKNSKKFPERSRVVCSECQLIWCFTCHCPWHNGFTCKQFHKGDQLLKSWAQELHHGQRNAQRCPKCKIFIQRTSGCDHIHCSRCKTNFCYRCGDQLRKLKFFGDHYSKLSVFGCKFRYKADKPLQRKFVRGAVFGGKLIAAPVIGVLGACAGVVAMVLGLFALPVYGGIKVYRHYESKRRLTYPPRENNSYLAVYAPSPQHHADISTPINQASTIQTLSSSGCSFGTVCLNAPIVNGHQLAEHHFNRAA